MTDTEGPDTEGREGRSPGTRAGERIGTLDALRGFAIIGILLVNIRLFRGPVDPAAELPELERYLNAAITVLAEGKFISALAFLFGVGFAIQTAGAERRGESPRGLLARRLTGLFLFGAAHAVFIWSGDILLTYAILGFAVLPLLRLPPRALLVWAAGILLAGPALLVLAGSGIFSALSSVAPAAAEQVAQLAFPGDLTGPALAAYASGGYGEMTVQRLRELLSFYLAYGFATTAPQVVAMLLLGLAAVRAGWVRDPRSHARGILGVAAAGLAVGVPLNLYHVLGDAGFGGSALVWPGEAALYLGAPALSLGYLGLAALLFGRFPDSLPTRRLSEVGRMALTNYLLQSVVLTAIFYGLRLYGEVGLPAALGLCLVTYAINFAVSYLWLSRYANGPTEWLWRRLTYAGRARG
ncbi:MAG: DUF418 domain-containing protein [Rubrobacter sp.]|nr:DUF418 domain-containing protein [Rubrobacter sp.]